MASVAQFSRGNGPRRAILDLAPLELDCMNTLWPLGEATVRQIQQRLALSRPRAYTTIMTIMDRLARKGVVTRRKLGRAYLYRPNLTAQQARTHAVAQLVEGFFEGSAEALAAHLAGTADASGYGGAQRAQSEAVRATGEADRGVPGEQITQPVRSTGNAPATRLDESLL